MLTFRTLIQITPFETQYNAFCNLLLWATLHKSRPSSVACFLRPPVDLKTLDKTPLRCFITK